MPIRRIAFLLFFALFLSALPARSQAPPEKTKAAEKTPEKTPEKTSAPAPAPASAPAPDYSQEPIVVESLSTTARFENDGTGVREQSVRVRVQTDAGVQQFGELVLGYGSANERAEIVYVRVHKADGSVVVAGPESVKEVTTRAAHDAPLFSDFREKHVTVPSLQPGDTLEYDFITHVVKPLDPGQFWFQDGFFENAIVLDEHIEVNLPRDRVIKIKSRLEPKITEEGDRRIYRWTHATLQHSEEEEKDKKKKLGEQRIPDLQITTFTSWNEVGRWYADLERDRVSPTPDVRGQALDITRDFKTEREKVEALYDYVSKNIRYVSISFGIGRFQPHLAGEILTNQYGDCKDKHTLLAALLMSLNIRADAVLIPATHKLDPDIPSPSQFDHVITAVVLGNQTLWLDTTAGVAPFGLLVPQLRGKQALDVPLEGEARLVKIPADPPFLSTQMVEMEGTISQLGKLTAHIRYALRGDNELGLRLAFRNTPQAKWKEIAETIASLDGFRTGEVTHVEPSEPTDTHKPFQLSFDIIVPNFLDWSNKKTTLPIPMPLVGLPEAPAEDKEPIELGSPLNVTARLRITLPAGYAAQAPVAVAVARDYADYRSNYKMEGGVFTAERTVHFLMHELPAARASDFRAFTRAIQSDENQTVAVASTATGTPAIPATAKASELNEAGEAAIQNGKFAVAVELLRRVVELEPKDKSAWNNLGSAYLGLRQFDDAAAAFRKQIEVNPFDEFAYNNLGITLEQQQKFDEAIAAFRKQIEVNPLDKNAHALLGSLYVQRRKYAEAIPELEKAVVLAPQNPILEVALGQAYLNTGETKKAMDAFDKASELSPSPGVWNNIAYELSDHHLELYRAMQYAESAVETTDAALRNVNAAHIEPRDLGNTSVLASFWDTLGWVYFQRELLDKAEPYIRASWLLDQHGEVGDHLGQIYEKRGKKDEAIHTYALAMVATRSAPGTRARLAALLGDEKRIDALVSKSKDELVAMRTISLGPLLKENATADFFVILTNGGKVDGVRFISGSEKLRGFADKLSAATYPVVFPDDTPTKLIRRGTLSCSAATGNCNFVLLSADTVTSVN
jgi:tetratricopeptide (TPR) repeat protein/transglutaminase-like putative cysteine protease